MPKPLMSDASAVTELNDQPKSRALSKSAYLYYAKHEHYIALVGTVSAVLTAFFPPIAIAGTLAALATFAYFAYCSNAVGLGKTVFSPIPIVFLRSLVIAFCIAFIFITFPNHRLSPILTVCIIATEIFYRGWYQEFLLRRGVALWIAAIIPAALSTVVFASWLEADTIHSIVIFSIALLGGSARFASMSVFDALLWLLVFLLLFKTNILNISWPFFGQ